MDFLGKVLGGDDDKPQVTHGGSYPAGGGVPYAEDDDFQNAAHYAANHAPEDSSYFSSILGELGQRKHQVAQEDIDEEDAVSSHKAFFGSSPTPEATSSSMGSAAALQALKLFTSSSETHQPQSQSAFIGLAMSQASKLFDQQASAGNVAASVDKQSAVMKAGEMALKMYLKSQAGHGGGLAGAGTSSGSGSGSLGGLLSLASKYVQ
ncbi:hypothetical protein B0T25DRAFT_616783 [Lasiosphaeria hispida]|uniref:DUF7721 domain-containing protein n=1 Tax=Lasiosphaeria hispida TaxID=260671 RepID=A0AAJ0H6B4_9PEZI|nr:hypothetical protein B0T25DRAFT_616783 [Lasiosphaeria hispida]